MSTNSPRGLRAGWTAPFVQIGGFVRKEMAELARQPRLLLVLVLGPFIVLLLFAVGYDQQSTVLRTAFVGPADSVYEESIDDFADDLRAYVTPMGYRTDLVAAEQELTNGEIDLIVVFPADPAEAVLAGDQAVISVLHDKLDPIQQTAVEVSARVAVQELNAIVLEQVVIQAQDSVRSYEENLVAASDALDELDRAVAAGDEAEVAARASELEAATQGMQSIIEASETLTKRLDGNLTDEQRTQYETTRTAIANVEALAVTLGDGASTVTPEDVDEAREALRLVEERADTITTLDPAVVVRPFAADTENLLRESVRVNDYFAPGAVALLVQHMVLTFAALGLVSDRALGLFEIFRVGPIGAGRVILGKYLAYTLIGSSVTAALIAAISFGLGVPFRGSVMWVAIGMAGLIVSSIGLGLVLSLLARSDTQAVQFAMLALLAGLFFGGFFLDLDAFRYPARAVSWVLPLTYGVRILRDVMLRGIDPSFIDLAGLGVTAVVFALAAWALLSRQLRRV